MIKYITAGETHGPCLSAIIEGIPAGLKIDEDKINKHLQRRQKGYGRGGRMKIEVDKVNILSGVRGGYTLGSPITLCVQNRDWENWQDIMGVWQSNDEKAVFSPRPGHADLVGGIKYNHKDLRNVLERASARETAIRVAVGCICRQLLEEFGINIKSRVVNIGKVEDIFDPDCKTFYEEATESDVGFQNPQAEEKARKYIDELKEKGLTVGGVVEVVAENMIEGLGSYVHFEKKLDARLAGSLMSIQAVKGVEIGMGFECGKTDGSNVQDEIYYDDGYKRKTNRAGGIEGGMSNGEDIVVRACMKPIPTQMKPLMTVNIKDKKPQKASVERSDVCAVPAFAVVCESCVAITLADAFLEKFSNDNIEDIKNFLSIYKERVKNY